MSSNLQQSEVLKELGLNDKNSWVLYDEKARLFFEYLSSNLDADNILTEYEYKQLQDILTSGQLQQNEELSEELKNLETYFPGILTITDDEIYNMEAELEMLEADSKAREERIEEMEEEEAQQLQQIKTLERKCFDSDFQANSLSSQCFEKISKLAELQESNKQQCQLMKDIFIHPQNPSVFIYQMPMDHHINKCLSLFGQLEIFMMKHFKTTTNLLNEVNDDCSANSSINDVKKRIIEVEKAKFEDGLTASGWNYIIEHIEQYKSRRFNDYHEMRVAVDEITAETEKVELNLDIIQRDIHMMIEQIVDQKMVNILSEHFKGKNKLALKRLDAIKSVQNLLENISLVSELLWVAVQLDLERIKNRVDNTEELDLNAQECFKRIRKLKSIGNCNPVLSLNELLLEIIKDTTTNWHDTRLPSIGSGLHEYIKHQENLLTSIESCIEGKNLLKLKQIIRKYDAQSESLREFIFNGPTNHPHVNDAAILMEIHERDQKTRHMMESFDGVKNNYTKSVVEPWQNDRLHKMERNLWIYFLTEPKVVLDCIKEVQKVASQKGTQSFKALNINL